MAFDMSRVQRGARNRRTPYHEAAQKYDPKGYTVYNHMYFPIRFDSFESEFETLLNGVTLWDVAVERCLEIGGPDGFRFAQLLTPRDLSRCAVGQGKYVLICDSDGGIINDPVLTRMDESTFWFALASSDALLFARGLRNAYPDLDVTIREADVAPLQVQGPKSKDLMAKLIGPEILDLRYYFWTEAKIAGGAGRDHRAPAGPRRSATRCTSPTRPRASRSTTRSWRRGRSSRSARRARATSGRIEGAIFNWGADMTYENDRWRWDSSAWWTGSLSDDASISMRALRTIKEQGCAPQINGLELDGQPFPELNNLKWPIVDGGEEIGRVTSAIYSPRLERNIGFGWLPVQRSTMGERVTVETEWGPRSGTVVEMPFVDPGKQIPVS
jgi:aminomethyltransferase